MGRYEPKLLEAVTATARMDALCEFIEFWLGPRQISYGEPAQAVNELTLPMPLKRLYEFAGRWPSWEHQRGPYKYAVPVLSHQDSLVALQCLKCADDGKVIFLVENQGVWDCRTLLKGDDPPVWCCRDKREEHEKGLTEETLVCDSLSRFLVTFALQELTLGSRLHLFDEGLNACCVSQRDSWTPVWTDGPDVHGSRHNYRLWGDVLVAELWDEILLAANHQEGIEFLAANQGPINLISLMMTPGWNLEIRSDGSACIRYLRRQPDESAEAPAGTFDFVNLVARLTAAGSDEGHHQRNAMVAFHRKGQSGGTYAKHVPDGELVTFLFRLALDRAIERNPALERRFATEWPL